ncbi:hypothetical protein DEO72_LG3g2208 [Vigna unguiculata]|uniref:Uncharacterized protein n=1 Tax=Vigna unguiculata TaxID=3917 RepID=A0A4D6LG87_VIGUN|nr:hypothetical protein DEO72_LG3g2208 [Vigna unguiculata]
MSGSPFLFVYGDDRVIRYTRADVDTGDVEDVQATKDVTLVILYRHNYIDKGWGTGVPHLVGLNRIITLFDGMVIDFHVLSHRGPLQKQCSPFLFVYGDDRVIRYTRADVDTGDVEDVQATK